jgi:hypothetical protein
LVWAARGSAVALTALSRTKNGPGLHCDTSALLKLYLKLRVSAEARRAAEPETNRPAAGGNVLDFGGIVRAAGLGSARLKVMKREAKFANSVAAATRRLLWGQIPL